MADRSEADRALDDQRKPVELFEFFGVKPKMSVAELAAGMGYSSELLARIVGPEGRVYGQNTPFILNRFAEGPWSERLGKPVMTNVVRVDSELESPLPAEARDLDAVFLILFYHDTVWFETDRSAMNRAIFEALRPGGVYGIVDHSARAGDGVKEAKTLHRIEQTVLAQEVLDAGFVLEAEADFLRNPSDARDWNAAPSGAAERRGTSDRFVLRFVKPQNSDSVTCSEPRKKACTREHRPVCGQVDTGVRCIKAPCPSTETKTYSNACTACADEKVMSYVSGACTIR
jgi:predicted methyltransferase